MTTFETIISLLMAVLGASAVLGMYRIVIGPSVPDRATAFDNAMLHVVGLIALFVVLAEETLLLDGVIVVSVLGFLGTVALARYIEGKQSR
jgi:multisubunit Na+/H+ antiporter MnhF subunit